MRNWSKSDILYLQENSHLSYFELGKELGVSKEAVRHQFRQHYIRKIKASHKTYYVNETYFSTWSSEMAYTLGFIFADASVRTQKKRSKELRIFNSDRKILIEIRELLGSNHPIALDKRTSTDYVLSIPRMRTVNDLQKLGMTEANSKTMKFPNVPNKYFFSFVRGYFDGDGHVKVSGKTGRKIRINFASGSKEFLTTIKAKFEERGICCSMRTLREGYENESYQISVLKKSRKLFYHGLYSENPKKFKGIKMESKYQLFIEYFEKNIKIECLDCRIIMDKKAHNHVRCKACSHERDKFQKRESRRKLMKNSD
ncbi:MAG: hypothetical protein HeimC2_02030 [Candidatus Heimdallarchaeota archaeon LC_2]|nr:MAG: hypothetical protein HeimC2_02030 [Candidatus Heimdallarchaeota archaeon LC_2]